jgi:rhodanese-related sulfurtransferase
MDTPVSEVEEILARAGQRGRASSLPYAGEVTPQEAYRLFSAHVAKIIDVRSRFEYDYIGRVPATPSIPWRHWPSGEANANFLEDLRKQCSPDDIVLFLCRSGARSHSTASTAAAAGFTRAFNIDEGFEGDLDRHGQRGNIGGWRKAGLPWLQD